MGVVEYWNTGVLEWWVLLHQTITPSLQYSNNEFSVYFVAAALMSFTFTSKFNVLPARG